MGFLGMLRSDDAGVVRGVVSRFIGANDLGTPSGFAGEVERVLKVLFSGAYFEVEHERGVRVLAGRMSDGAHAKFQLTKGYEVAGLNPRVGVNILPEGSWGSLTLKMSFMSDDAKAVGVKPIRRASGLAPEKALELVVGWFKANAPKLKA